MKKKNKKKNKNEKKKKRKIAGIGVLLWTALCSPQ